MQVPVAEHLERVLGWDSVYAWNEETFGPEWHPGPRRYQASGAHPRPAGGAETAEPRIAGLCYRRRRAGPDRLRRQPLDGAAQPRFLSAAPQRRTRGIPGRPGAPEIRPRPGDRLRQRARFQPLPCRARAEAHRHPHAQLQPPRRPGLFRQRTAAGLHRAEGGLQEHPRGLRRQPLRLHGRERHRPRLPSQRLSGRFERRPRPLRLHHRRVGALCRMEAARRGGQGQPGSQGAAERHAGAPPAAGHRGELHPVRREQAGSHPEGHCAEPPGAGRQPGGGLGVAAASVETGVPGGQRLRHRVVELPLESRAPAKYVPAARKVAEAEPPYIPRGRSTSSSEPIPTSAGWASSGTPRAAASPIPWPSSPRRCGGSWKATSPSC